MVIISTLPHLNRSDSKYSDRWVRDELYEFLEYAPYERSGFELSTYICDIASFEMDSAKLERFREKILNTLTSIKRVKRVYMNEILKNMNDNDLRIFGSISCLWFYHLRRMKHNGYDLRFLYRERADEYRETFLKSLRCYHLNTNNWNDRDMMTCGNRLREMFKRLDPYAKMELEKFMKILW